MPSTDGPRWQALSMPAVALVLLLWPLASGAVLSKVATETADAHLLKAAFVYNFAKFTRWPDSSWTKDSADFRLCTIGSDPVVRGLTHLVGEQLGGRPVVLEAITDWDRQRPCHLLYIARSARTDLPALIEDTRDQAVLTVSEIPRFARQGGVIELFTEQDRVRFRINLGVARGKGLQLSARLLDLAQLIGEAGRP